MTSIDSFPIDNKKRVVYLYSCIKLNPSPESENILVEVLLIELNESNPNRLNTKSGSYGKYAVSFRDLDTVQVGSIWHGQNLLEDEKFNFNHQLETIDFEFDLIVNQPKVIAYNQKIPESDQYYIPQGKIYIPKKDEQSPHSYHHIPFLMSKYCILKANNNIEVFINCIHVLHALYVPSRKEIRGDLLNENLSISKIVDRYLDDYRIVKEDDREVLLISVKENQAKKIGREALAFLANLALNSKTQEQVETIRKSLNNVKLDKNNKPFPNRFPSVFPPHATVMKIRTEGIWLENQAKFLVTHVNAVSGINDYPIKILNPKIETEVNTKTQDNLIRSRAKNKKYDIHISINVDPSHGQREVKKQTDIVVDLNDCDIEFIDEVFTKDVPLITTTNRDDEDNDPNTSVSSGDRFGNQKNRPRKFENIEKKPRISDLKLIFDALLKLRDNNDSNIESVYCINNTLNLTDTYVLFQLGNKVDSPIHRSWIDFEFGRYLLFLKIEIKYNNDKIYFIDIDKNKHGESFCGFLFTTNKELSHTEIKQIGASMEKTKGTRKWLEECAAFIISSKIIQHRCNTQAEWTERFNRIFKDIIN